VSGRCLTRHLRRLPDLLRRRRAIARLARDVAGGVALTYDDGPGRVLQPRLLAELDGLAVRATFFVHGGRLAEDPEAGRALLAAGHEIAAHGAAHVDGWRATADLERADVADGVRAVREILGIEARRHRPPHGRATAATIEACRELGLACTWWTHDGLDARGDLDPARLAPPAVIAERVVRAGGGVVLLHAHDRPGTDEGARAAERTIDVTRAVVAAARRAGLAVGALEDVVRPSVDTARSAA